MTAHEARVELLERAIGYTRGALADVSDDLLGRPTPCAGWRLDRLLDHMADSLTAFLQASQGVVDVTCPTPQSSSVQGSRVAVLRDLACTLLGAWAHPVPARVRLADRSVDNEVILHAAALEIAVHGWDVAQATGSRRSLPEDLAEALLPVARTLVGPEDRGVRFADPVAWPQDGSGARLLGFCGRLPLLPHRSQPQQGSI